MAQEDRADLDAVAPERVAELLVKRYDLSPPVDVRGLLDARAEVQELLWPYDCDALVYGLTGAGTPKVFVRMNQPELRKRFTMAHELGHIAIPWHMESVACHVGQYQWTAGGAESEANRFASHLLAPNRFLRRISEESDNPQDWLAKLTACDVSAHAGLLALQRVLLPGYLFVLEQVEGPLTIQSRGTRVDLKWIDGIPQYRSLEEQALSHGRLLHQGRWVRWYRFLDLTHELDSSDDRNSREILGAVARRWGRMSDGRSRLHVINGVVGGNLARRTKMTPEQIYAVLVHNFKSHSELSSMLADPEFVAYLNKKAIEVASSRPN